MIGHVGREESKIVVGPCEQGTGSESRSSGVGEQEEGWTIVDVCRAGEESASRIGIENEKSRIVEIEKSRSPTRKTSPSRNPSRTTKMTSPNRKMRPRAPFAVAP